MTESRLLDTTLLVPRAWPMCRFPDTSTADRSSNTMCLPSRVMPTTVHHHLFKILYDVIFLDAAYSW